MSTKPLDATLKELIEGAAAAWPSLLGLWRFGRVELIDADVSTVTSMEESSTYQYIVSKGVAKGEVQEARKILLRLGRRRFGPPDPQTMAAIEAIVDLEPLEQLTDRILEVCSWQELLAVRSI